MKSAPIFFVFESEILFFRKKITEYKMFFVFLQQNNQKDQLC
jgi:hypothetical protein